MRITITSFAPKSDSSRWLVEEDKLLLWGGNANNGTNSGLGYANSNNAFSNSNANIGARQTLKPATAKSLLNHDPAI